MAKPRPIDPCGAVPAFKTAQRRLGRIDADEPAVLVNQCATGIARVNYGVGLDGVERHQAVIGTDTRPYRTIQGADDAVGETGQFGGPHNRDVALGVGGDDVECRGAAVV
jgi:hypothetical protein